MIRINLLRNTAGSSDLPMSVAEMTGIDLAPSSDTGYIDPKEIIVKVCIILFFPIAMYGVDYYLVSQKTTELNIVNQQIAATKAKTASYGDKAETVRKFKIEKEGLTSRIEIIKKLSIEGNKILKRLDALHSVIPKKSWLSGFETDGDKFTLTGLATDDVVVSQVMQNLEENIYFTNVRMESTEEVKVNDGVARKFKVRGQVNKNE